MGESWHRRDRRSYRPDQIAVDQAVRVIDVMLAVGLFLAAVALAAPALTSTRSRWLMAAGVPLVLAGIISIGLSAGDPSPLVGLLVLVLVMVVVTAGLFTPMRKHTLVVIGLATVALAPCVIGLLMTVGQGIGSGLTALAANPPINAADEDIDLGLTLTLAGLALTAATRRVNQFIEVIRYGSRSEFWVDPIPSP